MADMPGVRVIKFNGDSNSKLTKWKIKNGTKIRRGSILCLYDGDRKQKANVVGTVSELLVKEDDVINPGQEIIRYQSCTHPEVMKDLCAECGEDLRKLNLDSQASTQKASVSMVHAIPELKVSAARAEKLGKAHEEQLIGNRKLVLLVDLDQTIIHTTNDSVPTELADIHHFQLYGANSPWYHTKLRPHTAEFLERIANLYELHICTFGARMYAHTIAEIIDPTKKYFSIRILSRDECLNPTSKTGNLKSLFPCGDSLVCIIDDREDVWSYAPNLIAVRPYNYFKNTGDINSPYVSERDANSKAGNFKNKLPITETPIEEKTGGDEIAAAVKDEEESEKPIVEKDESSESKHDNKMVSDDNDDYLLYLEDILTRIHSEFYNDYDSKKQHLADGELMLVPDLKEVVPRVRKRVLEKVNIVFSGVVPTNLPIEKSKPYVMARSMGATVSKEIVFEGSPREKTTHVVAAKLGTAKVNVALKSKKIFVVNPLWLLTCAERWEHVEEELFRLQEPNANTSSPLLTKDQEKILSQPARHGVILAKDSDNEQAIYDPVTGKRVRRDDSEAGPSGSQSADHSKDGNDDEKMSPHHMVDFSPLSNFSANDLKLMGKEVDDACSEGDDMSAGNSSSSDDENVKKNHCKRPREAESSSEESMTSEFPRGWSKKVSEPKRACLRESEGEDTRDTFDNHFEISDSSEGESGSDLGDSELAADLEREFLGS